MFPNLPFKISEAKVSGKALTRESTLTRRYKLRDKKPSTYNIRFKTIPQAVLTVYSCDFMIFTWNLKIIKLFWPPSKWSKTCQNKTNSSMLTSYHLFIDINTSIKTIKWTLLQVWGQSLTHAVKTTRIYELWYIQTSTYNATLATIPWDKFTGYSYDVMRFTCNWYITKVVWTPSQWAKNH